MRQVLNQIVKGVTNGATAVTLAGEQVPPGQDFEITHVGFQNDSQDTVNLSVGILQSQDFTTVLAPVSDASGSGWGWMGNLILVEGQALAVQVTGTATSGPIKLFYCGHRHKHQEPDFYYVQALPAPAVAATAANPSKTS